MVQGLEVWTQWQWLCLLREEQETKNCIWNSSFLSVFCEMERKNNIFFWRPLSFGGVFKFNFRVTAFQIWKNKFFGRLKRKHCCLITWINLKIIVFAIILFRFVCFILFRLDLFIWSAYSTRFNFLRFIDFVGFTLIIISFWIWTVTMNFIWFFICFYLVFRKLLVLRTLHSCYEIFSIQAWLV